MGTEAAPGQAEFRVEKAGSLSYLAQHKMDPVKRSKGVRIERGTLLQLLPIAPVNTAMVARCPEPGMRWAHVARSP
jgi:hypothetical protein